MISNKLVKVSKKIILLKIFGCVFSLGNKRELARWFEYVERIKDSWIV